MAEETLCCQCSVNGKNEGIVPPRPAVHSIGEVAYCCEHFNHQYQGGWTTLPGRGCAQQSFATQDLTQHKEEAHG